jgi:hypothetical protein
MSEPQTLTEPATPYSAGAMIEFLDAALEKGWLNPSSTKALRTASVKILSIDRDWEQLDLRALDWQEQFERFERLKHNEYTDGSFRIYKSRFHQAIRMYIARLDKDPNWKSYGPGGRTGSGNSRMSRATTKPSATPPSQQAERVEPAGPATTYESGLNTAAPPVRCRHIDHRFPLRDDLDVLLQLPRDLTAAEANRLAKFISTLAWDDTPANDRAAPTNAS